MHTRPRQITRPAAFTLVELPAARRRGFTLIELMVVVAIIASLIAVLLPSLNKARTAAKAAVCASNLRQLANAAHTYAAEHRGLIPVGTETVSATNSLDWRYKLARQLGVPTIQNYNNPVELYDSSIGAVFDCPMAPFPISKPITTVVGAEGDKPKNRGSLGIVIGPPYGNAAAGNSGWPGSEWTYADSDLASVASGDRWRYPDQSLYLADAYRANGSFGYPSVEAQGSNHIWPPSHPHYYDAITRRFADRHNGTSGLFNDGHVELFPTRELDGMKLGDADNVWDVF